MIKTPGKIFSEFRYSRFLCKTFPDGTRHLEGNSFDANTFADPENRLKLKSFSQKISIVFFSIFLSVSVDGCINHVESAFLEVLPFLPEVSIWCTSWPFPVVHTCPVEAKVHVNFLSKYSKVCWTWNEKITIVSEPKWESWLITISCLNSVPISLDISTRFDFLT